MALTSISPPPRRRCLSRPCPRVPPGEGGAQEPGVRRGRRGGVKRPFEFPIRDGSTNIVDSSMPWDTEYRQRVLY